jgi:hypothetical protein
VAPDAAAAAIAARMADPSFRQEFLKGGAQQKADVAALVAKKVDAAATAAKVDAALAGTLPTSGFVHANTEAGVSPQNLISAVAGFRELGVGDEALRELLTGKQTNKETFDRVAEFRQTLLRDPEWMKRWLGGDLECRKQMALCNIVKLGGVKKE